MATKAADRAATRRLPEQLDVGQGVGRLAVIQAMHVAGESMFAISLAGSLFFNVSLDASRSRILLYLALTLAPFAVLGTLIGPFLDRARGGHRIVLAATFVGRAALVVALSANVQNLVLYPIAFGILVLARTFSITRNTIVPYLVLSTERLVHANAVLAMVGVIAGAVASGLGALVLTLTDARWLLLTATVPYGIGLALSLALPRVDSSTEHVPEDLVEIVGHSIREATASMSALRAAFGFLTFHAAFVLKAGGAPAWFFGLLLVANGAGGVAGTAASPYLRKRLDEHRMLTLALMTPALVGVITALRFHRVTLAVLVFALGAAANVGRRAFDSVVQTHAPHASRGQAYATLETRLELAWVGGALLAVTSRAVDWLGVGALALGLITFVAVRFGLDRLQARIEMLVGQQPLPRRLLTTAEDHAARGDQQLAVIMVGAAADAATVDPRAPRDVVGSAEIQQLLERLSALRRDAIAGSKVDAAAAIEAGLAVIGRLGFDGDRVSDDSDPTTARNGDHPA